MSAGQNIIIGVSVCVFPAVASVRIPKLLGILLVMQVYSMSHRSHGQKLTCCSASRRENRGYTSFDDFLMALKQSKRKNIRQERKHVAASGLRLERLRGADLKPAHWDAFYRFYRNTTGACSDTSPIDLQYSSRSSRCPVSSRGPLCRSHD